MIIGDWMAKGNATISSTTQKDIILGIRIIVEMTNLRFGKQHNENGADYYIAIGKQMKLRKTHDFHNFFLLQE
ncbi:uncharacterized protein MONOS_11446 [Monocercomonoides exilis]|uniref:uncharacterized protein n=1 Tax=Monocercomonoides exilis TaxID=2049356 RepID=UPI00355948D6|nr:hypothetical protein MONOS_11446 [Monocercomonoides exilis]|eukprot:MONOS_11446.1-p1 / transcript=MONOS_11446.1 / gene=MONOS_11446 / organism=Monocercomonoides_exilis_PA203 / gene_product=unspecified product / transcript_product=unspecified product / location=Mono_scaffold00575:13469-13748(-) / protein_length=73 / sequence_SO=supercontig / SO=protein_coding / is_pseudo=false